jgi:hypothetical protein
LSEDNTSAENHCTIFTLAESPLDEKMIWVGTDDGNIQLTTDGGKTWTNLSKNYISAGIPAQTWVSSIEPSRFDKNIVYATFDNHMYGDMKTYLGKSTDMGKTWKLLTSEEFTGFAHKIREDLVNKDLLFLGTEMGLFATVDGGNSWFRMKNHIPDYCMVRDIQIQPQTNDLVLATHGRGIIVVNDISPMRSLTQEIVNKEIYVFPNAPMTLTMGKYGGGGVSSPGGWDAGNPADIQPIQYYLKDRVNSGEVKIEIYDAAGKLVQSVPATKRKGINKVYWNLRYTPPKTAQGSKKMDYSGFIAPLVKPGNYTVKLKIGSKEYVSPLQLVHDTSNHMFSESDRELQHKTAMQLYQMHEQLYALVEKINEEQKQLKIDIDSAKNPKNKKVLTDYNTKLESLRGTLLATKTKSIFADEKRLREDISDVYISVSTQETRPSSLQLNRMEVLKETLKKSETNYNTLHTDNADKIQEVRNKEKATKDYKPSVSRTSN